MQEHVTLFFGLASNMRRVIHLLLTMLFDLVRGHAEEELLAHSNDHHTSLYLAEYRYDYRRLSCQCLSKRPSKALFLFGESFRVLRY